VKLPKKFVSKSKEKATKSVRDKKFIEMPRIPAPSVKSKRFVEKEMNR